MNRKFNIATLMLATSLAFAGCANSTQPAKEDTKVEENATDKATAPAEEKKDATDTKESTDSKDTKEDNKDADKADSKDTKDNEAKSDEKKDEKKDETSENSAEEGNVVLHRGYPDINADRSFPRIVVATSGDKIIGVSIDEYQYFDADSGMKGVPNSEGKFGEGTKEGKILASKVENDEVYSKDMKDAGGKTSLMDNYNAITDYAKGKTIEELEKFLDVNKDNKDAIMDAISGATFNSTPDLLKTVLEVAKDNTFISSGNADKPEDIKLQYALGAPHGEKGFGEAVVAMEGDKIIAASIDEFRYLPDSKAVPGSDKAFGENFADSSKVLMSKLANNDTYSNSMKEKGSTVSIKDNFTAIDNFVSGKSIDEIKDVVANAEKGKAIDAVTGATLVDTVGYLQLILDAAEK